MPQKNNNTRLYTGIATKPMNCLKTKKPHKNGFGRRKCQDCITIYVRERYKRNSAGYADKQRARSLKNIGTNQIKARRKIAELVRQGKLKKPTEFKCVDCKKQAQVYDHRDYLKPFDVAPLCQSCNTRRPTAKNKTKRKVK